MTKAQRAEVGLHTGDVTAGSTGTTCTQNPDSLLVPTMVTFHPGWRYYAYTRI